VKYPPPKPGDRIGVRVDDHLAANLAVLVRTGLTITDAVRTAVEHLADAYRSAWDFEHCPDGHRPVITGAKYAPSNTPPGAPSNNSNAP
jgi:hypothetical protein